MRILYVCDALAIYGGMERVLVEKANWLAEHGNCEVCLLTVNQGDHPISFSLHSDVIHDDLDIRFYRQYHLPLWKRLITRHHLHLLFRKRLKKKMRELVPDIIVCTRLDYLRDLIRIKGGVPLVFESHSSRLSSRFEGDGLLRRLHVWYLQSAVRKAQMVVALTKGDADEWKKLTPRVCVIPNVVHLNDSGTYSDCMAKSVIYVGRFCRQKDIGTLLQIWGMVSQRHSEWQLHIYAGYGELQEALLGKIDQMNARIIVHGPTGKIHEEYMKSSILLLTSFYEPFGLVLPEAMSCGLPVVSFDCPYGPADIITDGVDGFLIRNRNTEDFADKVCSLIEDIDMRIQMGRAGLHSSKRFSVENIMPLWKSLFERISIKS